MRAWHSAKTLPSVDFWHSAKKFLPIKSLRETFAECLAGFAECPQHSTKRVSAVVDPDALMPDLMVNASCCLSMEFGNFSSDQLYIRDSTPLSSLSTTLCTLNLDRVFNVTGSFLVIP